MKHRTIKRYANRKMYDVEKSSYVSLSDLAGIIKSGEHIRVTDKSGKKDYTAQVLRQIIFEQSKQSDKASVSTLHEWVRAGGSFFDKQWEELRVNMEEWFKEPVSKLFRGLSREDFDSLKNKVNKLEKKIDALDKQTGHTND